jgi:hypothetical protein
VKHFHLCPPLRDDPQGYLAFIENLIASRRFDVLLPTHEQRVTRVLLRSPGLRSLAVEVAMSS